MVKIGQQSLRVTTPKIESCATLDLGTAGYAECLRAGPNACRFALPFGYAFLCHHPKLSEIMSRGNQLQATRVMD
jgi:hypothetical protein